MFEIEQDINEGSKDYDGNISILYKRPKEKAAATTFLQASKLLRPFPRQVRQLRRLQWSPSREFILQRQSDLFTLPQHCTWTRRPSQIWELGASFDYEMYELLFANVIEIKLSYRGVGRGQDVEDRSKRTG
jgi:hypothetical protein